MKRKAVIMFLAALMLIQTGCSSEKPVEEHKIVIDECDRKEYEVAEVEKGDLTMIVKLTLNPDQLCRFDYNIKQDELKVDELKVSIGDRVKVGDVMVTFKADDLDEKIETYERILDEDQLMYDYYTKLKEKEQKKDKDKRENYDQDIKEICDDMNVAQLYLDELYEEIAGYRIVATENGIVTNISPVLQTKVASKGITLIGVTTGTGLYSVNTAVDVDFQEGQIYTATYKDDTEIDLKLISIEEANAGVADTSIENMRKLVFEPVDGILGVPENAALDLEMVGKEAHDVLNIPKEAVKTLYEDTEAEFNVVYIMKEDGFREARVVEIGDTVNDRIEIKEGLSEGEKVTVK